MINIIPKPYHLVDLNKKIKINGFNIKASIFEEGIELFKEEYSLFLNGEYEVIVNFKKFNNEEAYNLFVLDSGCIIEASNAKGVFYATRSLKQLLDINGNSLYLSLCEINDKPKFSYRSFSLDDVRHFAGVEEVKKIIDVLSLLKIRYLHWHLSDDQGFRVDLKKFPKLYEIGAKRNRTLILNDHSNTYDETVYHYAYTEEEVLEIIEYARSRFVSIIPEFDTPGHTASLVASYPFLHCKQIQVKVYEKTAWNTDIICPGKETTYEFLEAFFDEIMKLFKDCEYIHLGGDEVIPTNWGECDDCRKKMEELGLTDPLKLQDYFSLRLINIAKKYNKKLIMWADGIHDNVDSSVILQYWTWQMIPEMIEKINNGRDTIYSPCCQCYFDNSYVELPLKTTYGRGIVLKGLTKKGRGKIFGMECNMWREFIRTNDFMEFMMLPRLHAFSESAWTYRKNLDYEDFKLRLKYHNQILDDMGMVYAKDHIFDAVDPDESIKKAFRKDYRYIEYDKN